MEFLRRIFSTDGFMPHSMCYEENTQVILLHVISDAVIALAYFSIPITLIYFVRRRQDLSFDWILVCFAIFIVACGTTHIMEIVNVWYPVYWLSGFIKVITAVASIITAILLVRLVPRALKVPSADQLRQSNEALESEVKERRQAILRVEALNGELKAQASQLEDSNKELESFAYSVSHDLRAPLRHIDGYVELLKSESPLDESGMRYAKVISASARQMGVLIDSLLTFSRMGRSAMTFTKIDTNALVREVRESLELETRQRSIEWTIADLPMVVADKNLFRQVWVNLMGNAVKYTQHRDEVKITIGYQLEGADHLFFITDNGAGFDMQYADKLFGIFQRLHFKEEFEGTGIGLANVRRIVSRHGGKTWAQGEVNVGATFYFTLPISTPESS